MSSNSNDRGDSDIANDSAGLEEASYSRLSRSVSTDNTAEPARKRAKWSESWEHFETTVKGRKCKYCARVYSKTTSSTVLNGHIRKDHPSKLAPPKKSSATPFTQIAARSGNLKLPKDK